jgi:RNA polymerase sigma factor (sigma-70 family)
MLDGLGKMAWFDRAAYEAGRYERKSAGAAPAAASPEPECGPSSKGAVGAAPASDHQPSRRPARTDLQEFHLLGREADASEATLHLELVMCLRDLLDALPEKEAALVRGTFFEGRTLTEAAKRVGISVAWASRLQTRTLADLRIALERGGFA